jgi:hypothetical protein
MLPNRVFSIVVFLPAVVLLPGVAAQAGDANEKKARAIIERAFQAMGGKEKLAAIRGATWTAKGKFYSFGPGVDFQGIFAAQGTDKARTELRFEFLGQKLVMISVVNGDKGWVKLNDILRELDKKTLLTQREHAYFIELASLTPLARDEKDLALSALGEAKVENADALVVKISRKGVPDVALSFDKTTSLPIKAEWKSVIDKKEQVFEIRLDNYQDVGGVKVAMKVVLKHNGKLFQDCEISDFVIVDRLDDKSLEKP